MWQNLYQKTIYEIYRAKKHLGYKIFEFDGMFVILWNDQQMFYFNMAHCGKFGQNELDFIKKTVPNTFLCVASSQLITDKISVLKEGTPSYLMILEAQNKIKQNQQFNILRVTDRKTLADFCDVATSVYEKTKDRDALFEGYAKELELDNCFRYVGYIDDKPAGTVDFSEGKDAACISWGAVKKEFRKQGLYKAMLVHGINHEIERGFNKIVLNSSEMGRDIYAGMGFVSLANRYNYVLGEKRK